MTYIAWSLGYSWTVSDKIL